jgi:hypothetical protein
MAGKAHLSGAPFFFARFFGIQNARAHSGRLPMPTAVEPCSPSQLKNVNITAVFFQNLFDPTFR